MPMFIKPRASLEEITPKDRTTPQPLYLMGHLEEEILRILNEKGTLVRDEICVQLNQARTTIFDNLMTLVKLHFVTYFTKKKENNARGRPWSFFQITPEGTKWVIDHPKVNPQ